MAGAKRFEELLCWRESREFTREIYLVTRSGRFCQDFAMQDQIRRAAVSTMSNIAEGFGRKGDKDFLRFLNYAKGSLDEVRSVLYVAVDADFIPSDRFSKLYQQSETVSSLLAGLIRYLRRREC
jgi:four helix bundle protein